ncbi:MAG: c-type cytochrome [Acidobacteria bacterium]|nr:c-type cytochrome [Acidobacteriota bacterium]
MRVAVSVLLPLVLTSSALAQGARPQPAVVDTPTVKVLTGLTVPEFEAEMQHFVQALGNSCGACHVRGNFTSDENPKKLVARRMIEMTKLINSQFFADFNPAEGASRLGKVTCFTCHQGEEQPKATVGQ